MRKELWFHGPYLGLDSCYGSDTFKSRPLQSAGESKIKPAVFPSTVDSPLIPDSSAMTSLHNKQRKAMKDSVRVKTQKPATGTIPIPPESQLLPN